MVQALDLIWPDVWIDQTLDLTRSGLDLTRLKSQEEEEDEEEEQLINFKDRICDSWSKIFD